jgi:hypothetical protein
LPKRNYGFEKRQKELNRQQKREDKRQRRLDRTARPEEELAVDLAPPDAPPKE